MRLGREPDLAAAVAFLARRPDVDPAGSAASGSRSAASCCCRRPPNRGLRAVVSEGAGLRSIAEDLDDDVGPRGASAGSSIASRPPRSPCSPTAGRRRTSRSRAGDRTPPVLLIARAERQPDEELNRVYHARGAADQDAVGDRGRPHGGLAAAAGIRAARRRLLRPGAGPMQSRQVLVFRVATGLVLVHALDDAFVHRGPGLGLGQHALAGAISVVAALRARSSAFPSLRAGLARGARVLGSAASRSSTACSTWCTWRTYGVIRRRRDRPAGAVAGGLVLVGSPRRSRGGTAAGAGPGSAREPPPRGRGGRAGDPLRARPDRHGDGGRRASRREPVGKPPSAAYESVRFRGSDGLELAGWYRPSRNGAGVRPRARRRQRSQGLGRPRADARGARLRRAALRRPRQRRERRQPE